MKLYDYELSANCYKVRLILGFLGVKADLVPVDFHPGNEHRSEAFLDINPMGQLPVLEDAGHIFRESQAILTWLAVTRDASQQWFPVGDAPRLAKVQQWLGFAEALNPTLCAARLQSNFGVPGDAPATQAAGHRLMRVLDEHLWFQEQEGHGWLVDGPEPTVADVAVFPGVILSEEGGISRQDYPAIRRWTDRFRRIPGFSVMSGVFPASPAREIAA